jgi:16S rRNA (cytosine1402-N4)-methyltransferase
LRRLKPSWGAIPVDVLTGTGNPYYSMREHQTWHVPVMAEEVQRYLVTTSTKVVVDCTLGTGGHAERLLEATSPDSLLIGIDLDDDALAIAAERLSRFGRRVVLKKMNFRHLAEAIPRDLLGKVDALLIDCGISMLQIVRSGRGFSFDRDGGLDMRFDQGADRTAASVLAHADRDDLRRLLTQFGEGANAGRISRAIVRMRDEGRLKTTGDLAEAVKTVVRARAAKSLARVFLAIRSRVNDELGNLAAALEALPEVLATGGRACVIAYHSSEDLVVKTHFKKYSGKCVCPPGRLVCDCGKAPLLKVLTPKPVVPTAEETRRNPSARSAKIRVVEKM